MKKFILLSIILLTFTNFSWGCSILANILDTAIDTPESVVIFDLDDTLFDSSSRSKIIFNEFIESVNNQTRFYEEIAILKKIDSKDIEYSIENTLINSGIENKVFTQLVLDFWKDRFFSNDYVRQDNPVKGAAQYVKEVEITGAIIIYLTGRDDTMRNGTIQSLINSGFPFNSKALLFTKSDFNISDIDYKKETFKRIANMGTVIAFFENEPENLNSMSDFFVESTYAVFLDTKHSPTAVKPYSRSIYIKDFSSY